MAHFTPNSIQACLRPGTLSSKSHALSAACKLTYVEVMDHTALTKTIHLVTYNWAKLQRPPLYRDEAKPDTTTSPHSQPLTARCF